MKYTVALLLALALCLSAAALGEGTVTVTGTAEVSAPTDHAVIRLGVRTRAENPTDAQRENNLRTDAVMKALTETCGIAADKIATSDFSLYTYSEWVADGVPERTYYQVTHDLSVTVDDIDQAGAVIDACVAAGANAVNGVSFVSSGLQAAYDYALKEALADARRKAELIAEATGNHLGKLVSVSTVGGGSNIYDNSYRMEAAEATADGATKLAPGTQNTSASVTVTWALDD